MNQQQPGQPYDWSKGAWSDSPYGGPQAGIGGTPPQQQYNPYGVGQAISYPKPAKQGNFNPLADVDGYYGNMARNRLNAVGQGYKPAGVIASKYPAGQPSPQQQPYDWSKGAWSDMGGGNPFSLGGGAPQPPQVAGSNKGGGPQPPQGGTQPYDWSKGASM